MCLLLEKQQKQIEDLTAMMKELKDNSGSSSGVGQASVVSSAKMKNIICHYCKKPGHIKANCFKLKSRKEHLNSSDPVGKRATHWGIKIAHMGLVKRIFHSKNSKKSRSDLVGTCPVVVVQRGGVDMMCLVDSVSEVTTVTEPFTGNTFRNHLVTSMDGLV